MKLEEVQKRFLDVWIVSLQLHEIIKEKEEAVKNQDYILAAEIRDKEKILRASLPGIEELIELRDSL